MSTTPVSSQSIYQELQTFYQDRKSDLSQLGNALQSGDLTGAQQAYSDLITLGQSGPFANAEAFSKSNRVQDFQTIGQDLQAGNLSGAETAFDALTNNQNNTAAQTAASDPATTATSTNGATPTASTPPSNEPSIYQQIQAYQQDRLNDIIQLGQDLQASNVNAAQQDFSTLTTLGQSGPNANGQVFEATNRAQDFQAIGQALQSGNLSEAQSAFATLASTFGKNLQAELAVSTYGAGTIGPVSPPVVQQPPTTPPIVQQPPVTSPPPVLQPSPVSPPVIEPPSPSRPSAPPIFHSEPVGPSPVGPSTEQGSTITAVNEPSANGTSTGTA
jgi:hypothetical protein